jgi:signal peptide peptidase SppA
MAELGTPERPRPLLSRLPESVRSLIPQRWVSTGPVVPVVRLNGVIGLSTPLRPGVTLANIARPLERAFKMRHASAVAILINSPGGSPVASHLIYLRIRALAAEHNVPVLAFAEDVAASGGYMIACAADEIICDQSSIVGSIGVIGGSFGFSGLMQKLGIERRLYTSGERKAMLDPFLPEKPEDVERLKAVQREIHEEFIALVKTSRGPRLTGPEDVLFSGEFWTGRRAIALGIADGIGEVRAVLRQRFGEDVRMPLMSPERNLFGRTRPGVEWAGSLLGRPGLADDLISAIEARALWSRYGL